MIKIEKTVPLSYTPGNMAVNPHLNHIYLSAGQNFDPKCVKAPLGSY